MEIKIPNVDKIAILNASDVYHIMQMVFKKQKKLDPSLKEYFWVIALNQHRKIMVIELVTMGSINATTVDPADVFTLPLHKRASSIILVHNHPSRYLTLREEDIDITTRLLHVGKIFRIKLADHVILTKNGYYSFNESGRLIDCEYDERYALTFQKLMELEDAMMKKSLDLQMAGEKIGREKEHKEIVDKLVAAGVVAREVIEGILK